MRKSYLYLPIIFLISSCLSKKYSEKDSLKFHNSHLSAAELIKILYYEKIKDTSLKLGYLDLKGKIIIKPNYQAISDFYGNYANIIKDNVYGYIDKSGKEELFPNYDEVFWFFGDVGTVKKNNLFGLIDRKANLITPIKYENINNHIDGVFCAKLDGKWIYLKDDGSETISKKYTYLPEPAFSKILFYQDTVIELGLKKVKQGLIDINGNIIISPRFDEISSYLSNNLLRVKNNGKYGIVNLKGEIIIPLQYDNIGYQIKNNLISVSVNRKFGFIDLDNKIIIPVEYDSVNEFSEGVASVYIGKEGFYIDNTNKKVLKITTDRIWNNNFVNGLALIKSDNKFGYINIKGEIIIKSIYEEATMFDNKLALVTLNKKSGVINNKGKIIVPLIFDNLGGISQNLVKYAK